MDITGDNHMDNKLERTLGFGRHDCADAPLNP